MKNEKVVEDVVILLSVQIRCILFSCGEIENGSANLRSGRQSWRYNRPENTNVVEDILFFIP